LIAYLEVHFVNLRQLIEEIFCTMMVSRSTRLLIAAYGQALAMAEQFMILLERQTSK